MFSDNEFVRKSPLHQDIFSLHAVGMRGGDTELKMQGGALRVELVLSGFFSAQNSSADSALKIPTSYIEVQEPRRNHGTFPTKHVSTHGLAVCGLVSTRFARVVCKER